MAEYDVLALEDAVQAHPISMEELDANIDSHWPHKGYFKEGSKRRLDSHLVAARLVLRGVMAEKKRLLVDVERMKAKRSRMTVELDKDGVPTQLNFSDSAASSSSRN